MVATAFNMNEGCEVGRTEQQDQLASTRKSNVSNTRTTSVNVENSRDLQQFNASGTEPNDQVSIALG